jgi:murein DD-endopeptidase MepM/ murein hydrolase activator NlpD
LGTALVNFDYDEFVGYGYGQVWQQYSNGLNEVLKAWGTPGTPTDTIGSSGTGTGTTWGPTEPPIQLEVPDCPGVVRTIDASHLPPSIYPKPTCGSGPNSSVSGNLGSPSGKYGTDTGAPAPGSLFWVITGGKVYDINQGYGMTSYVQQNPAMIQPGGQYAYCNDYNTPGHCGVDVGTPAGTLIYTPVAGKVICAGTGVALDPNTEPCIAFDSDMGSVGSRGRLQIELSNGDMLIFGHMSSITVTPGQQLKAGDPVGLTGSAGTGPHFHIEYRHPVGDGWTTYDPRDMFDTPAGTITVSANLAPVTPSNSKVAADTAMATTMAAMQEKYGFNAPQGQSDLDFTKYASNFGVERDLATKYAPAFNVEPQMVVWWTWAETAEPYDSYHYQNCLNDTHYPLDQACSAVESGNWQVGYGQQYAMNFGGGLAKAFEATHGDAGNATLVQQVGQNVLQESGINKTFPAQTITELMADEPGNRYWIFTLSRDQAISVYLTAQEIRSDLDGHPGMLYRDITLTWSPDYADYWQNYSNIMNDVLTNWGMAPGATTGSCTASTTSPSGSCSTMPDSLQGMTDEEFVSKINQYMDDFKKVAACGDVPWQMMAAINMREVGLDVNYVGPGSGGAMGPWQVDPTSELWGQVDPLDFQAAGCAVAKIELQNKAKNGPVGRPLRADMDPANHDDEVSIKDAFFGYNGRGGWQSNVARGCTPATDGHDDWNFDCSAYVMNNMDENHKDMCINGDFCDGQDGTWKVFLKLYYSTYGADGKILVYGGQCNLSTGAVNGIALPTAANTNINTHFFEPLGSALHIGLDIGNPEGAPVFAIADGDITNSGWDPKGGYYVLQHIPANTAGNSLERWVYYGHLDESGLPAPNSQVKAGQQIGKTGPHLVNRDGQLVTNGQQDGPHLHFDIRTTTSGAGDPTIHVNPCSIDQFKQGYPGMDCATWGNLGASWK